MANQTPKQPQGDVSANFQRILPGDPRFARMSEIERIRNGKLPLFRGTISAPEDPEKKFEYAVWDYVDAKGKTFLAGPVKPLSTRATVEDHLERAKLTHEEAMALVDPETGEIKERGEFELSPHTIIIRENTSRVRKSDEAVATLTDAQLEANNKKPSYWLKWQREAGTKEVRGSLWDKSGRYGAFLGGNTQYPLTREQAEALKNGQGSDQSREDPADFGIDQTEGEMEATSGGRRRRSSGRGR